MEDVEDVEDVEDMNVDVYDDGVLVRALEELKQWLIFGICSVPEFPPECAPPQPHTLQSHAVSMPAQRRSCT